MQNTIPEVIPMTPNYTITTGPLEALCECFKEYTGTKATILEIKQSFEKRHKKGINDTWMERFFESVRKYGHANPKIRVLQTHNKVPLVGLSEIAKAIAWKTATVNANYIALGSGSTLPDTLDTILQTEFVRGGFTQVTRTNNITYLDKFFGSSEVGNKTILEAWVFMGATWTANSWVLLSRVNINEVTTANETMTINVSITFTSAT